MSIDRKSHLSLIESVTEAVVGKPVKVPATKVAPKARAAKPSTTKVTSTAKAAAKPVAKSTGGGQGGGGGGGLQWGDPTIGGARNAAELAAWLNKQAVPGAVKDAQAASVKTAAGSGGSGLSEEEDFDMIDEILAEGIELYGEEGLAEILADFEETGEISEELADLLGLE